VQRFKLKRHFIEKGKNMNMKKIFTIIFVLFQTGISYAESPLQDLATDDLVIGTLGGAAIGAAVGAIADGGDGAKWGAIAGAGAGLVAGAAAKNMREQYQSEAEFLDNELSNAADAIASKEKQIASLEENFRENQEQISQMEAQIKQNQEIASEITEKHKELSELIKQTGETSEKYQKAIEYLDEVSKMKFSDSPDIKSKLETLEADKSKLVVQHSKLKEIQQGMKKQEQQLSLLTESDQ